jgi:hypothetical protein
MNKLTALGVSILAIALVVSPALAMATIRIDPHGSFYGLPVMLSSPATFHVSIIGGAGNPTTDPHIFLVMTDTSYNSLTGDVTVDWTEDGTPDSLTFLPSDWHMETVNSAKVPPGTTPGTAFTVACLRDHLNTTEPIYWACGPFLGEMDLTGTPIPFTVTLPANSPRMAVYVLGKTSGSELLDNRNPPTQPGFVVPEPIAIATTGMSLAALASYAVIRRKR